MTNVPSAEAIALSNISLCRLERPAGSAGALVRSRNRTPVAVQASAAGVDVVARAPPGLPMQGGKSGQFDDNRAACRRQIVQQDRRVSLRRRCLIARTGRLR